MEPSGVDVLVSLLTDSEATDLELSEEADFTRRAHLDYIAFPIEGRRHHDTR